MLNNLSKDKTGAPVKWKFNKSGIKQANKVGKRLATAQEKDQTSGCTLEQIVDTTQKKETKVSKPITESKIKSHDKDSKIKEHLPIKRKPGRPKLISKNQELSNKEDSETILNLLETNSDIHDNQTLSENSGENINKARRGRKKKVLSTDIRIKRLQILKRHMEKGRGRGRGRIKRIVEYHTTLDKKSESVEMNNQSTVSINQDKLKMLKEQIDSERRRGRGKGIFKKGRGRLKGVQDDNSISEHSDQRTDNINEIAMPRIEINQLEILKRQVGRGTSHRGRRGRPKWKHLNMGNRSNENNELSSHPSNTQQENQNYPVIGRRPRRGRGARWTALNRQTLNRTLLDQHTKQAVASGNFPLVNETLVDSENESIDSNLSNASSRARKRKLIHHLGIKLGPAKLLRSQDSMKTRHYKDSQNPLFPKKRKRTLSGEFELLDEVSLRKKMREKDDDDTSTVKSFDDSWADMTDTELNDSQADASKGQFDLESKLSKAKSKKLKTAQSDELDVEKRKILIPSSKSRESSIENDKKPVRRKGRPPKKLAEEYETSVLTKNKKEKEILVTKHKFVTRNSTGRLTIVGPGGKHFIKIQNNALEGTELISNKKLCNLDSHKDEIYDDAKISDLKDEVKIRDIYDENIKENEVVINVVIENSGVAEPVERKFLQLTDNLDKKDDDVLNTKVENDIDSKPSFITETEISQETILRSMAQVKHESKNKVVSAEESDENSRKTESEVKVVESEHETKADEHDEEMQNYGNEKSVSVITSVSDDLLTTDLVETESSDNLPTDSTKDEKLDSNTPDIPNQSIDSENIENNVIGKNDTSEMSDTCHSEIITGVTIVTDDVDRKSTSDETCDAINQSTDGLNSTAMDESSTDVENKAALTSTDESLLCHTDSVHDSEETVKNDKTNTLQEVTTTLMEKTDLEKFENELICESTLSIQAVATEVLDEIISTICQNDESEISLKDQDSEVRNDIVNPATTSSSIDGFETVCDMEAGQEISNAINEEQGEILFEDVKLTDNADNGHGSKRLEDESVENVESSETNLKTDEMEQSYESETPSITKENIERKNKDVTKDSINYEQNDNNITETSDEAIDKIHTSETIPDIGDENNAEVIGSTTDTCDTTDKNEELDNLDSHTGETLETSMQDGQTVEGQLDESKTEQIEKKESDSDSKPVSVESETLETLTATPETSGKTETKRVFQLRKKASRSPLEIIAMKHSMEERQYMLEETQRAIRREEKQKKMFQNKMMRQTIEQLSPPKQQVSPPKLSSEQIESISPEKSDENIHIQHPTNICRPCSVVLIDFVKYLKMSEQSEQSGSAVDGEDMSSTEEEIMTESESSEKTEMNIDNNLPDTVNSQVPGETNAETKQIPSPLKRPAKARKQAKSYNYASTLTAEIVSSPEPTDNGSKSFTVPPLRLKIKQKEKVKKKYKGHKWTATRNKARKQMSPVKRLLSRQKFEFETLGSKNVYDFEDEPSQIRKLDGTTSDSNGSTPVPNLGTLSAENGSANLSVQATRKEPQETIYRFKCNEKDCEFKSQMRNIMESHIYIHLKDTPFKCSYCDLIFASRNLAFNHSKGSHPEKEAKIVAVNSVDESKYYEEINIPQGSDNSNVIQADIADVQHSSESLIISVRLPRNMTENTTACYCCSHCEYYSSKIQNINAHVEEKHRELIQYMCSVCNKAVYRHGEGIARHFSVEHPDQPVAYKSLPDFYDVRKTIEKSSGNGDKGNIFDRMSDLFAGKKNSEKSKSVPEKTSAEADSTTAETDEDIAATQDDTQGSEKSSVTVPREPDGTEQLAQMFGPPVGDRPSADNNRTGNEGDKDSQVDETSGNDMGLKIVEVVSLQGASDFAKNVWDETPPASKSVPPHPNQLPSQVAHRPPVLIPTSSVRQQLTHHRPILPMPSQSTIDAAKLKTTTTTYKCEKCNVHAPILSAMVEHLRTGHKDIPRLFLCPYCRQYEGATEPDIHRHIKQFHPSPDTRSPPVALSSDAKQHLRTIEVPIGDTQKVNGKYLIEKNIYKCLKCKRHMPSLDYIYEHLEKEHNEVFVYVCPDCKRFRAKEEEVVFNHIKTVHNKNTDDIILSLAIEENLFTKVQCLIKDKSTQNKTNLPKPTPPPLTSQAVHIRQGHDNIALQQRPQVMVNYQQRPQVQPLRPPMQPVFPGMIQNQPVRMPGPVQVPSQSHPMHLQSNNRPPIPNQPMNKSALRKSRPVHIPQQQSSDHVQTSHTVQHMPNDGRHMSSPPPLMRGPPPLIRFQGSQSASQPLSEQSSTSIRSANFSMSDKVHRLQPHSQEHSMSSPPPSNRPVLKVPSVPMRRTATASPTVSEGRTTLTGSPLDLSRNSTPNSQQDISDDTDDVPPDAFQIFNLQPARPVAPQMHPNRYSQQVHNMPVPPQRIQHMGQYNHNMYNRPAMFNPMYNRPPPPYSQAIHQGPQPHSPPHQPALFKCPYCSPVVPLSMGEVAPHIKKYHPGQTVRFVKKD